MKSHILLSCITIFCISCRNPADHNESNKKNLITKSGYDLANPAHRYDMPGNLYEISGIAYCGKGILACVNDEEGKVYFFDVQQEKFKTVTNFAKKGDYEGITVVNNDIFIIRSDGRIYQFKNTGTDEVKARKIETPFTSRNNLEGIAYSNETGSLLVACKKKADINANGINGRAVYRLDLTNEKVIDQPYINLKSEDFKDALISFGLKPSNHMPFMPSGIGIHPGSGHIFLISSVGKLLLEFDKQKNIISAVPLSPKLFVQPEGICFDDMENLYIASEGNIKNGYILKFVPKKNQINNKTNKTTIQGNP